MAGHPSAWLELERLQAVGSSGRQFLLACLSVTVVLDLMKAAKGTGLLLWQVLEGSGGGVGTCNLR